MRAIGSEVSGIESSIPRRPVSEADILQAGGGHWHDVAVVTVLAPFANAVGAPVAA